MIGYHAAKALTGAAADILPGLGFVVEERIVDGQLERRWVSPWETVE